MKNRKKFLIKKEYIDYMMIINNKTLKKKF